MLRKASEKARVFIRQDLEFLFTLVTVLAQTLFALVRRHFMSFLFLSVRHSGE